MKAVCKFIRKGKKGFELVTWSKQKDGSKVCSVQKTEITPSLLQELSQSKYQEIFVN